METLVLIERWLTAPILIGESRGWGWL
jgi:hypothetical protein